MADINYTEIKIMVNNIFPYISVDEKSNRTVSGYMGELWHILETALHFKSKFIKTEFADGKKGLINGSLDIILLPIVGTSTDSHQFDFSVPIAKSWYELYTKRKGDGATSVSYIETWDPDLWLAFWLMVVLFSITLWLMMKTRTRYGLGINRSEYDKSKNFRRKKNPSGMDEYIATLLENQNVSLPYCFLIVLGTVTSQGFNVNTQATSLRIIMLVVLLFGLLMYNSYSAVLVSRLAVDKADILFPTLESVADRKTHVLCVRESSFVLHLLKKNESDLEILPMWQPIVNQPPCQNVSTVDDIARALCDDRTVILESPHIIASILETPQKCLITRMPGRYLTAYTSLIMRKRFEFRNNIDGLLRKLVTSGVIDYLQRKWLSRRIPQETNISVVKAVTINHIDGILLIYGIAILFSIIILFIQRCTSLKTRTNLVNLEYID